MLPARRRTADQQRQRHPSPAHFLRDEHHLVERRRDETAQAHEVGVLVDGGLQDLVGRHHHAEIDDLVAVAAEHDADDVLPDVVHVPFDRRQHNLALSTLRNLAFVPFLRFPAFLPLLLHERLQIRHGPLHRARAFDDLRQEHLARPEQIADDLHAVHQRAFDDVERPRIFLPRLLDVGFDEIEETVHERMRQPRLDRAGAPGAILFFLFRAALDRRRKLDQPFRRIRTSVEDDVFDVLEQILRDVLVDGELSRVDDAHVEARVDRVIQERRMDCLADDVVAAERKR